MGKIYKKKYINSEILWWFIGFLVGCVCVKNLILGNLMKARDPFSSQLINGRARKYQKYKHTD